MSIQAVRYRTSWSGIHFTESVYWQEAKSVRRQCITHSDFGESEESKGLNTIVSERAQYIVNSTCT